MNITLDQNPEQLTALLTVHLTEADYAPEVDKQIKEYTKRAQIKGFRPGKVPAALVKKMYGKGILGEEINKMLGKAVDAYVKEQKLRLLGEPLPVPSNVDFDTEKDFSFQFELGLLPDFELPADGSIQLERHQVELDEATLAETHEQIERQFGESTNPDASEHGDYLYGKLKKHDEEGDGRTVLLPTHKVQNDTEKFLSVKAGDAVVFPPTSLHGIDVSDAGRMYCLELMCAGPPLLKPAFEQLPSLRSRKKGGPAATGW